MIRSVKRAIVGMSGDPSNIRLIFVYRRARRVRWRLPPPPPSPAGARTPGSLRAHRRFLVVFWALSAVTGKAPGKREAAEARSRVVSRRSSRKPGFVVRGGRSRDTRPRTADLGSGDRGHGPMLSPDPCKSLAPPRVASREIPVDSGKSAIFFLIEDSERSGSGSTGRTPWPTISNRRSRSSALRVPRASCGSPKATAWRNASSAR